MGDAKSSAAVAAVADGFSGLRGILQLLLTPVAMAVLLLWLQQESHLFFHTAAELFSVGVALMAAVVGWYTWPYSRNHFLTFVAIGYFWVGVLDLLHAVTYPGNPVWKSNPADLSIQLWLAARLLEATVLLMATRFLSRRLNRMSAMAGFGMMTALALVLILDGRLPGAFYPGQGLTTTKLLIEYSVITALGMALLRIYRASGTMDEPVRDLMLLAVATTIVSEVWFTLYDTVGSPPTVVGHIFKLFSFWFIFQLVVRLTLSEPFRILAGSATTYDAIPDATLVVTNTGVIHQVNRAAGRLLGCGPDQLIGADCHRLFHPPELSPEECPLCRHIRLGTEVMELELACGPDRWWQYTLVPLGNAGTAQGMIHSIRDVSERVKAEEQVRRNEARLSEAQRIAGLGSWEWRAETGELFWSDELFVIFGYRPRAFSPDCESFRRHVHPDDLSLFDPEETRSGNISLTQDYRIVRPDGSIRHLHSERQVEMDENGRVVSLIGVILDVTERLAAERSLLESEQKYRGLMENASDSIVVADENGTILEVNRRACDLFGRPQESLLGSSVATLVPPDEAEHTREGFREMRDRGMTTREHTVLRSDGSRVPVEVVGTRIEYGNRTVYLGSFRDTSERKRIIAALRDSESKYRTLVENLPQSVFLKDTTQRYISCNGNYAQLLGLEPEDIGGRTDYDFFPPELADRYRADDQRVIGSGATQEFEEPLILEGLERVVQTVKTPVRDEQGEVIGVLGIFWDITDRKRSEMQLRESEAQLAEAERVVRTGSWVLEVETGRMRWSDGLFAVLGLEPDNVPSSLENLLERVPEPDRGRLAHLIDQAVDGSGGFSAEHTVQTEGGELRVLQTGAEAIGGEYDQPMRIIGAMLDITERKDAEQELRLYREELERMVEERTAQLKVAIRELESFSYSVSHDLHAPLRAINGFSSALQEDYGEKLDETGRGYLGRINAASTRMALLIDGLLMLSRVIRREPHYEPLDLTVLAEEVLQNLRQNEPDRTVMVSVAPQLPVRGDAALLRLLLENLIGNAWKFTRDNADALIELFSRNEGGRIVYCIRDNGIGFEPVDATNLFKPFHRLHAWDEYEGMGIGLATVKRIVEHHRGMVWAEGREGEGATFCFTLNDAGLALSYTK